MQRLLVSVLASAVLLTACDGSGGEVSSPSTAIASTPIPTSPTLSSAMTETTTPSATETPTPSALPSPLTSSVEQGGTYFGVYLAAGPQGSPELDAAIAQLAAMGIVWYPGDIACDQGAAEALGVPDGDMAVALYFETRGEAEAFASALDPPPLGIAKVKTYCAD